MNRQRRPKPKLRLAHVKQESDHRKEKQSHRLEDDDSPKRTRHLLFIGLGDGSDGRNGTAATNRCTRTDEESGLLPHLNEIAEAESEQHRKRDADRGIEKA